jgi:hypothetical protein
MPQCARRAKSHRWQPWIHTLMEYELTDKLMPLDEFAELMVRLTLRVD